MYRFDARTRTAFTLSTLILIAIFTSGCSTHGTTFGDSGASGPATFSQVYKQLLQPYCLSCHTSPASHGRGVDLSGYASVKKFVVPDNAQSSPFYITLFTQDHDFGIPNPELELVFEWIQSGAMDDTPNVTSIAPNSGPRAGGTAVTLIGTNFVAGLTVSIGNTPCSGVTVVSSTQIKCTTGATTTGGNATVTLQSADGTTYSAALVTFAYSAN
jgi:hypothetical protein